MARAINAGEIKPSKCLIRDFCCNSDLIKKFTIVEMSDWTTVALNLVPRDVMYLTAESVENRE